MKRKGNRPSASPSSAKRRPSRESAGSGAGAPGPMRSVLAAVGGRVRSFCGFGSDASYLWPRWIVLRAVGLVYVIIFSGILQEGAGLVGPNGLVGLADYCALAKQVIPDAFERFLRVPSVFLLGNSPGMVATVQWCGLVAAIALVLNLWPRLALFTCWAVLLSFVGVWREFSITLNDPLMLETALLCIPFAPAGFRPGLGAASPPRPITVFMMRWLVVRIMLTAGLVKMFGDDPLWMKFDFMQRMYETSPAPTVLAYYVYHLPHAYHVFEVAFTFIAEIAVPLLAIFGGRRGRAIGVAIWTVFQLGIQLTSNFAWLNTASIAVGLLFLDDQMIAAALRWLRLGRWAERLAALAPPASFASGWRSVGVAILLWLHFALTLYFPAVILSGRMVLSVPNPRTEPIQYLFRDFRSANCYSLYATTPAAREEVEFVGSNDGGATWRPYPFRYKPQREDSMAPFLAPRFGRFEATLQLVFDGRVQVTLIPDVAQALLEGNAEVLGLFAGNPFPDAPPKVVRMMVYRYTFTDRQTQRATGRYWNKVYIGDYAQPAVAAGP